MQEFFSAGYRQSLTDKSAIITAPNTDPAENHTNAIFMSPPR